MWTGRAHDGGKSENHTPPNGSMPELRRVGWGLRLCKNGHRGPRGHLHISHRQGLSREPGKTPSSQEMVLTCGQGRQWGGAQACNLLPGLTDPGPKERAGEAEACGLET